jgi:hypothetical protein
MDLEAPENDDIYCKADVKSMNFIKLGTILDAQDDYGSWHLSVVCEMKPHSEQEFIKLNFLPYPKGNRDEWFSKSDLDRLSGPFTNSCENFAEKDQEFFLKGINSLREYVCKKNSNYQLPSKKNEVAKKKQEARVKNEER